ncbi:VOC family protein [Paenibacillus jilunlii]|uniref:3-demethylubiquinone-9 3-methyltransferase n=1 Tax=Paenibacillus jilunlii TaxID=682956 RepID=A0A1G9IZ17_9BACL|nr:VOC family protein [Paenibacillus jilunlii]KWX78506.1 3-demethylubiquinone-9 3-methyltransferase [Paenibacillus jilunlii]SDL30507.1 PhnB protein [Paenibacillus jilunlii]
MTLQLNPFILLDGNAQQAIEFYQEVLGAKLLFKQTAGEGPQNPDAPMSEEAKARIAHSVLRVGETDFFVADLEEGQTLLPGNGINICITADSTAEAEQLYHSLKEGGQVDIELAPVYFSPAYGMVTDKFGVAFQIFTKRGR